MTDPQEPQEGWNTPDADDTAQAVIEAARALMKHFDTEIREHRATGDKSLWISVLLGNTRHGEIFEESDEPLPDTFFGCAVELSGALEAHDEATIGEDE